MAMRRNRNTVHNYPRVHSTALCTTYRRMLPRGVVVMTNQQAF